MDEFLATLPRLPSPAQMAVWDRKTIEFGIPEEMLMENAGREIFMAASEIIGPFANRPAALFMGSGNNGGDCACIARYIQDVQGQATLFCLKDPATLKDAAAWHLKLALADGARLIRLQIPASWQELLNQILAGCGAMPHMLADGLLGTGFAGQLRQPMLGLIESINEIRRRFSVKVLSVDIPSGLNAIDGMPAPDAIRADLTVTLAAAQPGLVMPEAREYTGLLVVRPIQIPQQALADCPSTWRLLDGQSLRYRPKIMANAYKNSYGHAFVFGGIPDYAGAAHLAALAALRVGAGLVTACCPDASKDMVKGNSPEIMIKSLPCETNWEKAEYLPLDELIRPASALIIGPGMGRSEAAAGLLKQLLALENRTGAVIDADALFLLGRDKALWHFLRPDDALTPHPGEAAYLLNATAREIQSDRPGALSRLCERFPCVIALKGAATIIGQASSLRILCPYDIPQLAMGGSGDVLAGCIGGYMAAYGQTLSMPGKVALAVITHAMAGLSLGRDYPQRGDLASQLADAIPHAAQFVATQKMPFAGMIPWPE